MSTTPTPTTARSVTKTVTIERPVADVFAFLADAANWPAWAIVNVKAIEPTDEPDWWLMTTPHGPARLRIRGNAELGILDHDYIEDQASWQVTARVVANGTGSEFMITFFQPPAFTDAFFDEQVALVDTELATLQRVDCSGRPRRNSRRVDPHQRAADVAKRFCCKSSSHASLR